MTRHAVQRFYRHQAAVYDATRWLFLRGRRRAVERLELTPDNRVLEVGCGTGLNFEPILARLEPGRGRLTGVDFSPPMLARARRRISRHGWPNVELVCADATSLALDGRFDAVLFAYSLTMIGDWQSALQRAAHHLAPGGRLVVLDFGRFGRWGPVARAVRRWLERYHVDAEAAYADILRGILRDAAVHEHLGGYYFIGTGRR